MHNIGFADVENGKTEAIRWPAANEIVTGYGSGKFGHEAVLICSQREPNSWASMILNDEVSANAILKRATKHYTVVIQPKQ